MNASITAGSFTYDPTTGDLEGPAKFMAERGDAVLAEIYAGRNHVFNFGCTMPGSNTFALVLVALQTEYAAWLGMRTLRRA